MPEMNNYSFLVDGGLHVSARAKDEETAYKRIATTWPRSDIQLRGVNLDSAERGLSAPKNPNGHPVRVHQEQPKQERVSNKNYADAINVAVGA